MKANRFFLLVILFLVGGIVFSRSPLEESFVVENSSNQTIIITREFADTSYNFDPRMGWWTQNLFGLRFNITASLFDFTEIRLLPGQGMHIVRYHWNSRMDAIPFMDKMRGIFSSLNILTEDGRKLITLDTLEEHDLRFEMLRGLGPTYILEIRD